MSWLFSRALVEASSVDICSAGEPSAPLNVMPTPYKFWRNDKTMEPSDLSQFGLTCAALTDDLGAALLTSYQGAFPAKTSAAAALGLVSQENEADSGRRWSGLFATLIPNGSSCVLRAYQPPSRRIVPIEWNDLSTFQGSATECSLTIQTEVVPARKSVLWLKAEPRKLYDDDSYRSMIARELMRARRDQRAGTEPC